MTVKALVFSSAAYEIEAFEKVLFSVDVSSSLSLEYFSGRLTTRTAAMVEGIQAVVVAPGDIIKSDTLSAIAKRGVKLVAVRASSVSNVDVAKALAVGVQVVRVPAIPSHSIAEYAVSIIMTLNRHTHLAHHRVQAGNLDLNGMVGFEMYGKTAGIIGTGKAGALTARILKGFGCKIVAYDVFQNNAIKEMGGRYLSLDELLSESHIVSLHAPLLPATRHMICRETIARMRHQTILINTSKSGLLDIDAVVDGLKSGKIGALGWDVGDGETELFRLEPSGQMVAVQDSLKTLMQLPNVFISGHQAGLTDVALEQMANTTVTSLKELSRGIKLSHAVSPE